MKTCKRGHQYETTKKCCPVCEAENKRKWKAANKAQDAENQRKWKAANKAQNTENNRKYRRKRKADEPLFKLTCDIRTLIYCAFKNQGWSKTTKTATILGCDFATLETHLIQTAIKNYGYWADFQDYHIDHIKPVSSATTEEELLKLNHYTNLQLLYPQDNLKKGNKIV